MSMPHLDYQDFLKRHNELTERARKLFEERSAHFKKELRYEITNIEFTEDGCTIHYESHHCSNCRPESDEMYISLDELLELD